MVGAYRAVLQEFCDNGSLAEMAKSALSARELRRLAAKHVIVVSSIGIRDAQDLAAQALARIVAARSPAA